MLEQLENRVLFAIDFNPNTGILSITGDDGGVVRDDQLEVFFDGLFYGADDGRLATRYYSPDEVTRIEMYSRAGNDTVSVGWDVFTPVIIDGGAGDDLITGGGGSDTLRGATGNDTLFGGGGSDTLNGSAGLDALHGGTGNDSLDGGLGTYADILDGGDDIDIADYSLRTMPLNITLDNPAWDGEASEKDTVVYCEVVFAGSGDDRITGNSDPNRLEGRGGKDSLFGGNGADQLYGGFGDDYLDGGNDNCRDSLWGENGNDTFVRNGMDVMVDRIIGETII
jgi:Ca2+-binding RTX toxin-like protein